MTIKSVVLAFPFVLLGWLAILMIIGLISDQAPAQMVLFPSRDFINNLPEGISIVRFGEWHVTLASPNPGFVKALYNHGAVIVLPSGLQGCFSL